MSNSLQKLSKQLLCLPLVPFLSIGRNPLKLFFNMFFAVVRVLGALS